MSNWLTLIILGLLLYALTYAPIFPAAWARFVQAVGGLLVVIGIVILVLGVLGIRV